MKEADIRPKALLDEYLRRSAEDVSRYFCDPKRRSHRPCPGCESRELGAGFEKNGFALTRCPTCRTLYVVDIPWADDIAEFYRDSPSQKFWAEVFFPAVAESRRVNVFRPRALELRDLLLHAGFSPQSIVDVGSGAGVFLEECRAISFGETWRAVEPNHLLAQACREKGFDTFVGFAADLSKDWQGGADLATSFEVIEHLTDPAAFLRDISAVVRPGGMILLTGLCGTGFDILTLGPRAKAVFPPHHLTFLSHSGVAALLRRCGLEEIRFLTPGRLDVDIVRNTSADRPETIPDLFLRHLLFAAEDKQREEFQAFLARAGLSSHMWVLARRPDA